MTTSNMDNLVLNVADIYCGAGGLSAGFANAKISLTNGETARFDIVYGLDKDKNAVATYNAYHAKLSPSGRKDIAEAISVSEVTGKSILTHAGIPKIDVLIAGPNCQGVSAAGLRNPKDARNEMFRRFLQLVEELQPEWFIMENVPGLTHGNNLELLNTIMNALNCLPGYRAEGDVLLAANYEVPQIRYRLFIIGNRVGARIRFPKPIITDPKHFKTVHDAIGDLRGLRLSMGKGDADSGFVPNHAIIENPTKESERMAAVKPGGDWHDMPVALLPERFIQTRASDQKGTYGRLEWRWPAYTITASVANVTAGPFTHPSQARPLSVREAARLQSFHDKHVFKGPVESQYRQVGNAVPPKLAEAVAEAILYCHFNREQSENWGLKGRITQEILEDKATSKTVFSALTKRFPGRKPKWDRKPVMKAKHTRQKKTKAQSEIIPWEISQRVRPKFPGQISKLRRLAKDPPNYRAAKRARAILAYFDGEPEEKIMGQARVSKLNIEKWIRGFQTAGLEGWRAYHTSIRTVFGDNPELLKKISNDIRRVRKLRPISQAAQNGNKRHYMNAYISELIRTDRFGEFSVRELISTVEKKLKKGIGTVYVCDLLAICDAILPKLSRNQKTRTAKPALQMKLDLE